MKTTYSWSIKVPIFRNAIVLRQLAVAIGLPFSIVLLFLGYHAIVNESQGSWYGVYLILTLFFLTYLFLKWVYQGSMTLHYVIDKEGIICEFDGADALKNKRINQLTAFFGFFTSSPTIIGIALLAQGSQRTVLPWKKVVKVKEHSMQKAVELKGKSTHMMVFTSKEDYREKSQFIDSCIKRYSKVK